MIIPFGFLKKKEISGTPVSVSFELNSNLQDADEYNTSSTDISSSDIWIEAGSFNGFCFVGLNIPIGSTITNAYVQFESHANGTGLITTYVYGQKGTSPSLFSSAAFNISTRPVTTTNIEWVVPDWATDERNSNQVTPDLSSVIQEIIDDGDYNASDNIVIILKDATTTNTRKIKSVEGSGQAAEIFIDYLI